MAVTTMANGRIVKCAAAADIPFAVNTKVRIRGIRWVGATAAAHALLVTDAAGTSELFSGVANAANYVESFFPPKPIVCNNGLKVTTLGSGTVYFYLE